MNDGSSAVALRFEMHGPGFEMHGPGFEMHGPVRAFRGTEPVDLGPPKQQAVLALLLLHAPQPVPLDRIVAALWGDDPPPNAVDVVQRFIGALRRSLDPERTSLITLIGGGYAIRAGENTAGDKTTDENTTGDNTTGENTAGENTADPGPGPASAPPGVPSAEPEPSPYPEAIDPWAGHDLFPPDPLAMS